MIYDVEVLADKIEEQMEVLEELNRGYQLFDRHSNMDRETLFEIGDIIRDVRFKGGFELTNMLYGLYDGYLYYDLLSVSKSNLDSSLYERIKNVVQIVEKYPKILG